MDITSADMIAELSEKLGYAHIELHFAEMKDPVKDNLKRFELFEKLGNDIFHPTVGAAVDAYLGQYALEWKP